MTELKRPSEILLGDPLSRVARSERRTLLGASAAGIVIAKSGLVPSKITALGIEFDQADQSIILKMLAWVIIYFLAAFLIYALSDLLAWRVAFSDAIIALRKDYYSLNPEQREVRQNVDHHLQEEIRARMVWQRFSNPVSLLRAVFEFLVPVVIAMCAVIVLLKTPPPRATPRSQTSSMIGNPVANQPQVPIAGTAPKAAPQPPRDASSK
jgi:hypothetical protein